MTDDTKLELAEQHVAAGEQRISKQHALMLRLEQDGHDRLLPEAKRLLVTLEEVQAEYEWHLAELKSKTKQGA